MNIWEYFKKNLFSLITVFTGFTTLILYRIGMLQGDLIQVMILTLVLLLTTSILIDRSRKLDEIHRSIEKGFMNTVADLGGINIKYLPGADKGLEYLTKCLLEAEESIELVSLAPNIRRDSNAAKEWEKTIEDVLLKNKVNFRYVFNNISDRTKRVIKHLKNPKISKFFAGYINCDPSVPMIGFLVIDETEVITIFPTQYGDDEVWVSLNHPRYVQVYKKYFQRLWNESKHSENGDFDENVKNTIEAQRINSVDSKGRAAD